MLLTEGMIAHIIPMFQWRRTTFFRGGMRGPPIEEMQHVSEGIRLNKALADAGVCSRRRADELVFAGRVGINGVPAESPGQRVLPGDVVSVDGRAVTLKDEHAESCWLMLNKPVRVVSTASDPEGRETVLDLVPEPWNRRRLFPVGRLDFFSEGLLLVTDDGELAHRLLSPKRHVDKVYYARVRGTVTQDEIRLFEEGIRVDEKFTAMPARLAVTEADGGISEILLTIREGKFHQVKRMFEAVGMKVLYLKRLQMGPVTLDAALAPGEYRRLTEEEIQALKEAAGAGTSLPPHAERGVPRGNEEYHEMSDSREE